MSFFGKIKTYRRVSRALGWYGAAAYYYETQFLKFKKRGLFKLRSNYSDVPLYGRRSSSDISVFSQIFIEREYACLDGVKNAGLIIDCGANTGYSSAYFLKKFPASSVIAIEPDPENFDILARNLKPYEKRVRLIHSGIWCRNADLVISETKYRDGGEWTRQVRECLSGEKGQFRGVDIGTLLKNSDERRISILKMDIEGAEGVIFSSNYEDWIDKVDIIVIELHDDSSFGNCSEIFFKAIAGVDFEILKSGELTICIKRNSAQGKSYAS